MTEHCQDHHELVKTVGGIDGKIDMLLQGQREVKKDISDLYGKFNENHTDSEIQKTKTTPIFWVIMAVTGYIIAEIIKRAFK